MSELSDQLKTRTRRFALDVLELIKVLPRDEPGPTMKRQLTKAATSVDMNYRAGDAPSRRKVTSSRRSSRQAPELPDAMNARVEPGTQEPRTSIHHLSN